MQLADSMLRVAQALVRHGTASDEDQQGYLRRAISTAYYALFHGVCQLIADALVRPDTPISLNRAWLHVYRALDHGKVENRLGALVGGGPALRDFPGDVLLIAATFRQLKAARHRADYDPLHQHAPLDARNALAQAELGLQAIARLDPKHRASLGVWLLLDPPRR
jgi:hypothetical protein